jgi:hypothetical protein
MMITKEMISSNHYVVQSAGNIVSDMGGEKVMLSIHNGKYYNLGAIGGYIWECIQAPVTIEQLVDKLRSEYEVERTVCEEHVSSFLNDLSKEGLVIFNRTGNPGEDDTR